MLEEYVQKAYELLKTMKRITPCLIARKFKLDLAFAEKVCHQTWLMHRQEARLAASELENGGFPCQLQIKAIEKNLERFKKKAM